MSMTLLLISFVFIFLAAAPGRTTFVLIMLASQGKLKNIFDYNLLGLCIVIEQQRILESNPPLPTAFQSYYYEGLEDLCQYAIANIRKDLDEDTLTYALAAIATCKRRTKLGKAIMNLEDPDLLDEFLEQF